MSSAGGTGWSRAGSRRSASDCSGIPAARRRGGGDGRGAARRGGLGGVGSVRSRNSCGRGGPTGRAAGHRRAGRALLDVGHGRRCDQPEPASPRPPSSGRRPFQVVHGTADGRVAVHHARDLEAVLQRANPASEAWIIEGSHHVEGPFLHPDEYERRLGALLPRGARVLADRRSRADRPPPRRPVASRLGRIAPGMSVEFGSAGVGIIRRHDAGSTRAGRRSSTSRSSGPAITAWSRRATWHGRAGGSSCWSGATSSAARSRPRN